MSSFAANTNNAFRYLNSFSQLSPSSTLSGSNCEQRTICSSSSTQKRDHYISVAQNRKRLHSLSNESPPTSTGEYSSKSGVREKAPTEDVDYFSMNLFQVPFRSISSQLFPQQQQENKNHEENKEESGRKGGGGEGTQQQPFPTGYTTLDAILGGGIPPGKIVEICAKPHQGKSFFAYRLVAETLLQDWSGEDLYAVFCTTTTSAQHNFLSSERRKRKDGGVHIHFLAASQQSQSSSRDVIQSVMFHLSSISMRKIQEYLIKSRVAQYCQEQREKRRRGKCHDNDDDDDDDVINDHEREELVAEAQREAEAIAGAFMYPPLQLPSDFPPPSTSSLFTRDVHEQKSMERTPTTLQPQQCIMQEILSQLTIYPNLTNVNRLFTCLDHVLMLVRQQGQKNSCGGEDNVAPSSLTLTCCSSSLVIIDTFSSIFDFMASSVPDSKQTQQSTSLSGNTSVSSASSILKLQCKVKLNALLLASSSSSCCSVIITSLAMNSPQQLSLGMMNNASSLYVDHYGSKNSSNISLQQVSSEARNFPPLSSSCFLSSPAPKNLQQRSEKGGGLGLKHMGGVVSSSIAHMVIYLAMVSKENGENASGRKNKNGAAWMSSMLMTSERERELEGKNFHVGRDQAWDHSAVNLFYAHVSRGIATEKTVLLEEVYLD